MPRKNSWGAEFKRRQVMTPLQALDVSLKKYRDGSGIRLATPGEIQDWSAEIGDASKQMSAILDDWSIVMILDNRLERLHLVGNVVGTTKTRTTSPIQRIDLMTGYVLTQSESFYQLGAPHEGEPDLHQVLALAKAIGNWREATGRGTLH